MNDLLHKPLRELATRLVRRELSAEALVRACLDRVAEVDGSIEAWTVLDADRALRVARAIDAGPVRGALHGVPVGVKDLIDTGDLPTAYGSPIYQGHQPAMDAACVGQLRTAGAYVLGKTVTTEFATMVPGKTRNPHSPPGTAHTPGGSSSGSAAAVAARMVPLALGTQTAASVVRPAAYCGVVGFKPTFGLLPVTGVKLQAPSLDTVGVFTRAVDDAAFAVGAMARLDLSPRRPAALRVALCRTPWWDEADADARRALAEAGDRLRAHGAQVIDVELPPHWAALTDAQLDIMGFEAAAAFAPERLAHLPLISAPLREMLDFGAEVSGQRVALAHALVARARAELATVMAGVDVWLAPSATGVAPAGLTGTGNPVFSRAWSALGVPCVHVPCGQGAHGLPVGVTVAAPPWQDALALGAAQWVEN